MKQLFLLLVMALLLSKEMYAQDLFVRGYVLSTSGDTIHGWVENLNWDENPNTIRFRQNSTAALQIYAASDINGFGMWTEIEEHYRAVSMNMDFSPVKTQQLTYAQERLLKPYSVFLRIRILGPICLYELKDSLRKDHFFAQKKGEEIEELIYHRYMVEDNIQSSVVRTDNRYRDQLLNIMGLCDQIRLADMSEMTYSLFHLSRIIQRYNICVAPEEEQYVSQKERPKVSFGPLVGTSYSSVVYGTGFNNVLQSITYDFSPGMIAGLAMNVALPRNQGKNALRFEGLYHLRRFQAQWSPGLNSAFSVQNIQLNLMYQYRMVSGKLNPYAGIGLTTFLNLTKFERNTTDIILRSTQFVTTDSDIGTAGMVNLGVRYQNLYVDIRYTQYFNPRIVLLGELGRINEQSFQLCVAYFLF